MHEFDLIPASYRQQLKMQVAFRLILSACAITALLCISTWIGLWVLESRYQSEISVLSSRNDIINKQQADLNALRGILGKKSLQHNRLKTLLSGENIPGLFLLLDRVIVPGTVWFKDWRFSQPGAEQLAEQSEGNQVTLGFRGLALDHTELSKFMERLNSHPRIDKIRLTKAEIKREAGRSMVEFAVAMVLMPETSP